MLYREINAVCSEIHTKHINILSGLNIEFVCVKPGEHITVTDGFERLFILYARARYSSLRSAARC